MNTTVDELKVLYTELGGSAEDVENISTIPDMIAALADVAGSTIELPAVSASDNGDVLEVVNGKWAKVATTKLPTVTAADEGSALMVNSSGAWDKGAIPTELPAVTSADNGKVLGVANGAWGALKTKKVYTGTTSLSLIVKTTSSPGTYSVDGYEYVEQKQAQSDIIADIEAGVDVTLRISTSASGSQPSYVDLNNVVKMANNRYSFFATYVLNYSTILTVFVELNPSNTAASIYVVQSTAA